MPDTLAEQLIETWQIHNRIHLYLLDVLTPDALRGRPAKGRSVGELFAHIHNVRLMWVKSADANPLSELEKIEKEDAHDPTHLRDGLTASAEAVTTLVTDALASGRVKGFKPHPAAFLGYLIGHESHHRGEIEMTLTQAGYKLDQKTSYGLWEWGVR